MKDVSYSLVQRNKRRGIMTWYARVKKPDEEHPRFFSLRTTKKGEATLLLAEKIKTGEFEKSAADKLKFKTALDMFMHSCEQNGVKPGTIENYYRSLATFRRFMNRAVVDVSDVEVLEAFNETCGNNAAGTFNIRLSFVSRFYRYLIDDLELRVKNPFRKVRHRKPIRKFKKGFWTLDQVQSILSHATSPTERLFWAVMAFAGFRWSEAVEFRRSDIHDGKIHVIGKGDIEADVPISNLLQEEIDRFGDGNWDFSGMKRNTCNLKKAVSLAGIQDDGTSVNYHRFRHSFGSNLIRAGANLKAAQMLMRHSCIQMTLNVYSHLREGDLLASVNLLKEEGK